MKNYLSKVALIGLLITVSCSKQNETSEAPIEYDNAFILSFESDKTDITFLNKNKFASLNTFSSLNENSISFSSYNNQLYVVSQDGPVYISKINTQTLNIEESVSTSNVSSPSYLQMYSETDGLIINVSGRGRSRKYNLSHVNITKGISNAISEVSSNVLFNNTALVLDGDNVLIADGKKLIAMNITTKEFISLLTFDDSISGILKDKNGTIWIAKEKRNTDATFTMLKNDYSISKTVTVTDASINLFKNSILSINSESFDAFWSESASGKIYKFNTETKIIEEFASPINEGISFNTVVKQHPKTKQVYVIGLEDFINTENSILAIYNIDKTIDKTVKKVGISPIDIYFSNKEFTN
jgi:hypothetical protein